MVVSLPGHVGHDAEMRVLQLGALSTAGRAINSILSATMPGSNSFLDSHEEASRPCRGSMDVRQMLFVSGTRLPGTGR
jgi:hypothetical protein